MPTKKVQFLILFALYICANSCNQNHGFLLRQQVGNYLLIDSYSLVGNKSNMTHLYRRKYYTKDTIANGAEIYYDTSGNILKWLWFSKNIRLPLFGIYFTEKGLFDSMIGSPFLKAIHTKNDDLVIEVVNPPQVKYFIGYRDFVGDKIVNKEAYEPTITDSTGWATFEKRNFIQGHTYKVYYYILNEQGKRIDSMSMELVPPNASSSPK